MIKNIKKKAILLLSFVSILSFAQNLNESFEGAQFPPEDWKVIDDGSVGKAWYNYTTAGQSGSKSAAISYHASQFHDDLLITPKLSIVANDSIHFYARNNSSTFLDEFDVIVSTTDNQKSSFTDTLALDVTPGNGWEKYSYSLNAYAGQDIYFTVHAKSKDELRLSVDNFTGPMLFVPTCAKVASVNLDSVSATYSEHTWNSVSNAISYYYELEDLSSNSVVASGSTTDTSFSINTLTANTEYSLNVQTICSATDTSEIRSNVFTTLCSDVSTFFNDFNGLTSYTMPNCWSSINVATSTYAKVGGNPGYSPYSGTSQLIIYNASSSASSTNLTAISPELNNLTNNTHRLRFQGKRSGSAKVIVGTMLSALDTLSFTGIDTLDLNTSYDEYTIYMPTVTAGHKHIAFKMLSTSTYTRVLLDDILWEETPSCLEPINLVVDTTTDNSAEISWDAITNAQSYYYEITELDSTTVIASGTVSTNEAIINTNLIENTDYTFNLQAVCSATDSSTVATINFSTLCSSVSSFFSDFNDLTSYTMPDCWSAINQSTSSSSNVGGNTGYSPFSGNSQLVMYNATSTSLLNTHILAVSPELDNLSANTHRIRFQAKRTSNVCEVIVGTMSDNTDQFSFVGVDTISLNTSYDEQISYFTTVPSNHKYVAFKMVSSVNYSRVLIDDVQWELIPSCIQPSNVALDSINSTYAEISWDAITNAQSYYYEITELDSTTVLTSGNVTTNEAIINSNLAGNTDYTIHVQSICSATDSSAFSSFNFTTLCSSVTEMAEGFENGTSGDTPDCWSSIITSTSTYADFDVSTSSVITGSKQVRFYNSSASSATFNMIAITPEITNLNANTHRVRFSLKGPAATKLVVGTIESETAATTFMALDTISVTTAVAEYINDFTITNNHKHLALKYLPSSTYQTVYMDDFYWEPIPNCEKPTFTDVNTIQANSANLFWNNPTNASEFQIQYGENGFTLGAGTNVLSTDTFKTITGLLPATHYDFYVRSICNSTDTSVWTSVNDFYTACDGVSEVINESFEGDLLPNNLVSCWEKIVVSTSSFSSISTSTSTFSSFDGTKYVRFNASSSTNNTLLLISPEFTAGVNNKQVRFNSRKNSNSYNGSMVVGTMLSPTDTNSFTAIDTFDLTTTYQEFTAYIANGTAHNYVAFRFINTSNYASGYLDLVNIDDLPTCIEPSITTINTISTTEAEISWQQPVNTPSSWLLEYGNTGFTPGTGTVINVTANPYTLSGLTYGDTVDVYLRALCSATDTSAYSSVATHIMDCAPETGNFTEDFATFLPNCWEHKKGLLTVNSNPVTSTSTSAGSWRADGYLNSGSTGAARSNIYGTTSTRNWLISPTIHLDANTPKQIEFDAGITQYNNSNAPTGGALGSDDKFGVLISLDNGTTWSDANIIHMFTSADAPSHTGDHYIFSLEDYTGYVKIAFYTESTSTGGDRDAFIDNFEISDLPAPMPDLAPTDIFLTNLLCEGNATDLALEIANLGTTDIDSFNITLNISGSATSTMSYPINTSILEGDTITEIITNLNYPIGTYNIEAIIDYASDSLATNDTITSTLEVVANSQVFAGNDTTICAGESIVLTASNSGNYKWDASLNYGNGITVTPTTTTSYVVLGINPGGCFTTDTIEVTVSAISGLNAGNDTTICAGSTLVLNGSGADVYQWIGNANAGQTYVVTPTVDTFYVLTGTNLAGCSINDTVQVDVSEILTPTIEYQNGVLSATTSYDSYQWYFNGAVIATTPVFTPTLNGVYTLVVENTNGCTAQSDYTVGGIGLDEAEGISVEIYPNPVNDMLNIQTKENILNLRVMNTQGKVLIQSTNTNSTINVSELSKGIYIISGNTEKGTFVKQFVKN